MKYYCLNFLFFCVFHVSVFVSPVSASTVKSATEQGEQYELRSASISKQNTKALKSDKAENVANVSAQAVTRNITYIYDNFGRLSQVKDGSKVLIEYQYDAVGNRSQVIHVQ